MISIKKYLNQHGSNSSGPPASSPVHQDILCSLCSILLDYIGKYVLSGESGSDVRARISELREAVSPELLPAESLKIQEAVRHILINHDSSIRDTATRTAVEMRHLAGILNQAVSLVAEGDERSISGLKKIQAALLQTSRIPDLVTLK